MSHCFYKSFTFFLVISPSQLLPNNVVQLRKFLLCSIQWFSNFLTKWLYITFQDPNHGLFHYTTINTHYYKPNDITPELFFRYNEVSKITCNNYIAYKNTLAAFSRVMFDLKDSKPNNIMNCFKQIERKCSFIFGLLYTV